MKLLIGKPAIDAATKSIASRGVRFDKDVHIAGVSCLNHIELHGDITLLNNLVSALPKGSRVNAFKEWAEVHGKVKYSDELKAFTFDKEKTTLLTEAIENSWVEFKPDPEYKTLDFSAALAALLKKANERVNAGKGDKIDAAVLAKANALFSEVK